MGEPVVKAGGPELSGRSAEGRMLGRARQQEVFAGLAERGAVRAWEKQSNDIDVSYWILPLLGRPGVLPVIVLRQGHSVLMATEVMPESNLIADTFESLDALRSAASA